MSPKGNVPVPEHIAAWAREPGPSRVLADAFARFERGQALAGGNCRVALSAEERRQLGWMLPATWMDSGRDVGWRELRAGLSANDTTLEAVVAHSCGPWRNRRQERRDLRREGDQDHAQAVHTLTALMQGRSGVPVLPQDTAGALGRGLFGRRTAAADADLIRRTLDAVPAAGSSVGLAVLAARVFNDAHALDRTTALGRAVARFVRLESALGSGQPLLNAAAGFTPQDWRATWAGVGVVCDQVSSQVLVLNLPLEGDAPAVAITTAAKGEPVWLTLRSLAGGLSLGRGVDTVFVCENPSIVEAAADALGKTSLPLICTFGRPSAAALRILAAMGRETVIKVQADSDTTGRSIVAALIEAHPTAVPWRMPDAGVVYEEELINELLIDLRPGRAPSA